MLLRCSLQDPPKSVFPPSLVHAAYFSFPFLSFYIPLILWWFLIYWIRHGEHRLITFTRQQSHIYRVHLLMYISAGNCNNQLWILEIFEHFHSSDEENTHKFVPLLPGILFVLFFSTFSVFDVKVEEGSQLPLEG